MKNTIVHFIIIFQEICNHLAKFIDQKSTIAITFASDESCTTTDIRKKTEKTKGARGLKVPFSMLDPTVVKKIKGKNIEIIVNIFFTGF